MDVSSRKTDNNLIENASGSNITSSRNPKLFMQPPKKTITFEEDSEDDFTILPTLCKA
jgi:hypothetical protein